jgi:hypothetical protein
VSLPINRNRSCDFFFYLPPFSFFIIGYNAVVASLLAISKDFFNVVVLRHLFYALSHFLLFVYKAVAARLLANLKMINNFLFIVSFEPKFSHFATKTGLKSGIFLVLPPFSFFCFATTQL